jgi:phosphatidate cytidylyltransferase
MNDLDPPTFQFGRRSGKPDPEPEDDGLEIPVLEPSDPDPADTDDEARLGAGQAGAAIPGSGRRFKVPFVKSETGQRVVTVIPWIAFAIAIVAIGDLLFTVALIGLAALGLREFFRMAEEERPLALPAYATVAAMLIAAHYGSAFQILMAFAFSFPVLFLFAAARDSHRNITASIAFTLLAISWVGLGFTHAVLLRDLPVHGGALLIDVLVATFLGDTAAYGAGRLFGSRKITPRISPNKTLEGLIGGFVGATMGFWFAGLYQDWLPGIDALLMGMVIGLVAPLGDLFASLLKRDLQVKDTGSLFGVHGGLLDRLDAVLFTVVAGYYLSVAFVY